jgi:hypothetical protein
MLTLALALALAPAAQAAPLQLTHQGRLSDATGSPLEGAHQLTVAIFTDASGGSPLWTDTLNADLENGAFSVILGAGASLDAAIFDGSIRYVELAVDGGSPLPQRLPITSVPYALHAGHAMTATDAEFAASADHAATADALSGPLDWANIANAPADADTLGDLGCSDGQVPTWQGGAWGCASPVPASVDVSTLSGTINIANLPVGSGANDLAAGDHVHSFGQITGELGLDRTTGNLPVARLEGDLDLARTTGNLPYARLPVGTAANTVAAGNHTHTAADVGAVPASGGRFTGDLAVGGTLQVGTSSDSCGSSASYGKLRYANASLDVCTEAGWITVQGAKNGANAASASTSCKKLHEDFPSAASGVYWVKPGSGAAYQVYCEEETGLQVDSVGNPVNQLSSVVSPRRPDLRMTPDRPPQAIGGVTLVSSPPG